MAPRAPLAAVLSAAAAASTGALAFAWHYFHSVAKVPRLYIADGPLKSLVLPHLATLLQPFRPTPWASNTHLQTIIGLIRRITVRVTFTRQLIQAMDGGTLGLDWSNGSDKNQFGPPDAPVLLVCHGINGGSHEGYCRWVCSLANQRGWRAVVVNYRGCNGLPLTSPRGYTATLTHDVHIAVESIKGRFPNAPIYAVGYSLGAILLAKYVGEADSGMYTGALQGSGLTGAALVSSPIELFNSSNNISEPWTISYLYNLAVAWKIKEFIAEHRAGITATTNFNVDVSLAAWTVAQLEANGVPTFGYKDRLDYYSHASSLNYLPHIKTPTLVLVSDDDPFLGAMPDAACAQNPSTLLAVTARGGHVAFVQGPTGLGPAYMDDAVLEFFERVQQHYPQNYPEHSLRRQPGLPAMPTIPDPVPNAPRVDDLQLVEISARAYKRTEKGADTQPLHIEQAKQVPAPLDADLLDRTTFSEPSSSASQQTTLTWIEPRPLVVLEEDGAGQEGMPKWLPPRRVASEQLQLSMAAGAGSGHSTVQLVPTRSRL